MTAPAIETTEDTMTGDLATPDSPRVAALRVDLAAAETRTRETFEASQRATDALGRASEAQAARAQALAEAETAALTAATRALAEGTGEARTSERRADGTAQRLRREMDRATVAFQSLQAEADRTRQDYQAATQAEARTRVHLDAAVLADRQQQRRDRLAALHAEMVALLAEGRRDNQQAMAARRAITQQMGLTDTGARASAGDMLLLPGENDTRSAAVAGSVFGDRLATDGMFVFYAADLCNADISQDRAEQIARRMGGDLADLFAGWNF